MSEPLVTVVLLNWNSGSLGALAARSVRGQTTPCALVVVDNASADHSLERILHAVEPDHVIRHQANLGFGAGMNAGIAKASTDFVLPLNCDVVLADDYVERAVTALEADHRLAVVGGAVRWVDSLDTAVPAEIPDPDEGPMSLTLTMRTRRVTPAVAGPCAKVTGACPVARREALVDVVEHFGTGPYDPTFDTYGEDIDLALKLARRGWIIAHEPTMRAVHARSFSSARRLADKRGRLRRNIIRGRWLSILRHVPNRRLVPALAAAAAEDAGFVLVRVLRGDRAAIADTVAAWGFVGRRIPNEVRFRRAHRASGHQVRGLASPMTSR